jgi:enoyl-CoA hydratase
VTKLSEVRYEVADGVATVTLADPARLNALSDKTLSALIERVESCADDPAVRCIVFSSDHARVFSAGGDLERFRGQIDVVKEYDAVGNYPRLFHALRACGKPTLCSVNGLALGGAVGLVLACDLVLAADNAEFGIPELDIGLFPFFTAVLLHSNISQKLANELILLGQRIDAHTALTLGMVNRVVTAAELPGLTHNWAQRLAARPATAVRLGKTAMYAALDMPADQAMDHMRQILAIALATDDLKSGIAALDARRAARQERKQP